MLYNKKHFFSLLKDFFLEFSISFDVKTSSVCGDCDKCCSSRVKFPPLSILEKDFIKENIKGKSISCSMRDIDSFFLNRDLPVCPFYLKGRGCSIYEFRPVFCRIFGPVDYGNPLPENCIYKKAEKRIKYEDIKNFQRNYNLLNLDYIKFKLSRVKSEKTKVIFLQEEARELVSVDKFYEAKDILLLISTMKEDPSVYYDLAWTYIWTDSFEEAIEYFTMSLDMGIEKLHPSIYQDLAYSYLCINKLETAEAFLNKAIKSSPRNVVSHICIYVLYEQQGEKLKARRKARQILRLFPGRKETEFLKGKT